MLRTLLSRLFQAVCGVGDEPGGRWEVYHDPDGTMVRVRWSIPDDEGRYLWVRHYANEAFGRKAATQDAARFNADKALPQHFERMSIG
jgi:hypothetical protein